MQTFYQSKIILFISSSPTDKPHLKSTKECKLIKDVLIKNNKQDFYELDVNFHVTPDNFLEHLDRCAPWIVHFSGHGYDDGALMLERDSGKAFFNDRESFFEILKDYYGIKCLLFNSCFSSELLEESRKYADYVIGFEGPVHDDTCILFSKHFYNNIFNWATIPFAFLRAYSAVRWGKKDFNAILRTKIDYLMEKIVLNQASLDTLHGLHEGALQELRVDILEHTDPLNRRQKTTKRSIV